jgi:protein-S-isoprenylcysteine O-methyltransferase Ste14
MKVEYLVSLGLYLFGLGIRFIYEHLKKTGRVNTKNILVFGMVLLAMCLLWAGWFNMGPMDPWPIALPDFIRWAGLGLVLLGMGLSVGTLIQLKGVENISRLVTTGMFSHIRHPMYAGFILWIIGWVIFHGALVSLFFGLVGIGNILYWRRQEERELESRYGETYREYRGGTWF